MKQNGESKMNSNNNNKQFFISKIMLLVMSFGAVLAISLLLPFSTILAVIFGVSILRNIYSRRLMMKRMSHINVARGIFGATPSMFGSSNSNNSSSLKYYRISRGAQHKEVAACPKCDSKMKKVGFDD